MQSRNLKFRHDERIRVYWQVREYYRAGIVLGAVLLCGDKIAIQLDPVIERTKAVAEGKAAGIPLYLRDGV